MNSALLLKDIQALLSNDVKFSKTNLSYVHHMVSYSSSPEKIVVDKLKRSIKKIHNGINKELIRVGLDRLRAKHPRKHDFTIKEVYLELLDLLVSERNITWDKFKAELDSLIKTVVNNVKFNHPLLTAFNKPPPDKLEQQLFLSIQSRSING